MKRSVLKSVLILSLLCSASGALAQQRPVPDWVRDGVIYEIYPRAFSQQGNFNAITARLDELKDLGVTILWLMPIHPIGQEKKKGTIGSPYAVRDYYAINPDYGTANDLKKLVFEAHSRGMKVIIDLVANHTSWDNALIKQQPEFYKRDAQGNITYPYDWYDIAALDYKNQELRRYMIDMLKYWIRWFDLDGFRCDVAGEVPTDFWESARVELEKIKPNIVMLAEAHKPELLVKAFDLDYSWPLHSALTKVLQGQAPASTLREEWEKEVKEWPKGALHMRFSDNHDERRAIARFGEKAALAASALMFTLDGVPMLYNGMEVGDTTESGAPALFEKMPIFWSIAERRPEFRKAYKSFIEQRRKSNSLRRGKLEWLKNSDESRIVSFQRRSDDGETTTVAINLSSVPFTGTVGPHPRKLDPWQYDIQTINGQPRIPESNFDAHWMTAAKNGFGTSTTLDSKVWFTLTNGVMSEVFYPTVDTPNVQLLQLVIQTNTDVETELSDTSHRIELPDPRSLTFQQINTAKHRLYKITKTYVTDPQRNTVLIDVQFTSSIPAGVGVQYDPSLNNSGKYDVGRAEGETLVAEEGNKASALMTNCGSGTNSAVNKGNLVQHALLRSLDQNRTVNFNCTVALGFGENVASATSAARESLAKGFAAVRSEYEAGWRQYVSGLPRIEDQYLAQFYMAAMVLRGLEDKTYRGAVIASPSSPWGGGPNANEANTSGYHAVWSRDLYHVATAFIALGDLVTANRLFDYLFRVQQKPDGSFPRNTWVDGRAISGGGDGGGLQMDQVALPLVLAYQLKRTDRETWRKHLKPAADLIVQRGPKTDQDRWEEKSGYFHATVAAQIAGLVCAAEIADLNGDTKSADKYRRVADGWAQNIEPIDKSRLDAGFLELVRLGVKPASDQTIVEWLKLVDQTIKVNTPVGDAWYRYNGDTYGETSTGGKFEGRDGVGRLWTLLTGERGEYEIAAGNFEAARTRLDTMARFANDGLMIPEQVWDRKDAPRGFKFGAGTGSATPLAWSMAQFIRLAINLSRGFNTETPKVVAERYLTK